MEDDSKTKLVVNSCLGAMGLGAVGAYLTVPKYGIWLAVAIIVLGLLLFGAWFLYRRFKARRQSRGFEQAIEGESGASPRAISDPNRRAALDNLRQKFKTGLQEFKSRGKDIYKLPWYVIIGEPGSGKSEAIRHSGIDFPPGLQNELQGSGGTVNMDWWFTNRSIILDTAGSMIFNESRAGEAPEWREFLNLLKKARPNCPINGLFLVLSVESLIKDSADKIAQKASKLAQQLDLIQRTLDVRFPVYLLVTKCDLLTGFREFFDNIEDPLLQHQMFGWSNPEPLDAHFRPDLVEEHLKIVAERLRRRRFGLLRESTAQARFGETSFFSAKGQPAAPGKRRLDEIDSLYALPESVMRLAPRLRRYLETVFVAGEWSAKPVFLRGIYFTSSMREGHALDEAMALATGVGLDQLPEDRPWEKNRSYFMRDLFMEKVFREFGLVTRATNTLQMLRKRKLLIFGVATAALLLVLVFSLLAFRSLKTHVLAESGYWHAGAANWTNGEWWPPIVLAGTYPNVSHFTYNGSASVPGLPGPVSVVQYHENLRQMVEKNLVVPLVFRPISWMSSGKDMNRADAQRILFEGGVLKPLVDQTRDKMVTSPLSSDPALVALHREALVSLIRLQADKLAVGGGLSAEKAARYIASFQSYLIDASQPADSNLVSVLVQTYGAGKNTVAWPPAILLGGDSLAVNVAISNGLAVFRQANLAAQNNIEKESKSVGELADTLRAYQQMETEWLAGKMDACEAVGPGGQFNTAKLNVDSAWSHLRLLTNSVADPGTNLAGHYAMLGQSALYASDGIFRGILNDIPETSKNTGLFAEIGATLRGFAKQAQDNVQRNFDQRAAWLPALDRDEMALTATGESVCDARWNLYTNACALAGESVTVDQSVIGTEWVRLGELQRISAKYRAALAAYHGPLLDEASNVCQRIAGEAAAKIQGRMIDDYTRLAVGLLNQHFDLDSWTGSAADGSAALLKGIGNDLSAAQRKFDGADLALLQPVSQALLTDAAGIRNELGFPILLNGDAARPMSPAHLNALKNLLPPVLAALNDPGWTNLLDDAARSRAHAVAQDLKSVGAVLAALYPDGKPAPVNLSFVPPKPDARDIVNIYRVIDVHLGEADSKWIELDRHLDESASTLVDGTIDGSLTLAFKKLPDESQPVYAQEPQPAWGLVRLIQKGEIKHSADGDFWIWNVKPDPQQTVEGTVDIKMVTRPPLPKPEDWPKQ